MASCFDKVLYGSYTIFFELPSFHVEALCPPILMASPSTHILLASVSLTLLGTTSPGFFRTFLFFQTGLHYVALDSLKLTWIADLVLREICLALPPKFWD